MLIYANLHNSQHHTVNVVINTRCRLSRTQQEVLVIGSRDIGNFTARSTLATTTSKHQGTFLRANQHAMTRRASSRRVSILLKLIRNGYAQPYHFRSLSLVDVHLLFPRLRLGSESDTFQHHSFIYSERRLRARLAVARDKLRTTGTSTTTSQSRQAADRMFCETEGSEKKISKN